MFGKIASMVHQAAEALAPSMSSKDEFVQCWKAVTTQLIEIRDDRQPVQSTKIPKYLERMLVLLSKEDKQYQENTGPCLEYLLQHKILETLHTLGRGDTPPGMKQQVLGFFSEMIDSVRHPLLPQVHVHKPVQRLIKCCGAKVSPTESEEVDFLLALCQKFRKEPSLVNFFIETYGTVSPAPDQASKPSLKFDLLIALLQLSKSEDYSVALKAYEGLIVCTSLPQESAANAIAANSTYCQQVVRRLVDRYKALPIAQDGTSTDLYSVTAKWGLADAVNQKANPGQSADVTALRLFFAWLDYIDKVVATAHPDLQQFQQHFYRQLKIIVDKLVKGLSEMFMSHCLLPLLLHPREDYKLASTNYLTRILQVISAPALVHEFAVFLLGADLKPEERHSSSISHKLRHALIQHCDHVSEQLSMATLHLFSALLALPTEHVIENLVLRNLETRSYHSSPNHSDLSYLLPQKLLSDFAIREASSRAGDITSNGLCNGGIEKQADVLHSLDSSVTDGTELSQSISPIGSPLTSPAWLSSPSHSHQSNMISPPQSQSGSQQWSVSSAALQQYFQTSFSATWPSLDVSHVAIGSRDPMLRELAKMRIVCDPSLLETTVNGFLDIIPFDLQVSSVEIGSTCYEAYLHDALRKVDQCNLHCRGWTWTVPSSIQERQSSFYEGTFLEIVFNMVLRMLDQPYSMNLQLTGLLSQLASFAHPLMHEYLLDAKVPLAPGARSLYSVLVKVRDDLVVRVQRMPHFVSSLMEARRRLTGQGTADLISMPNNTIFEGVVVLEEFCKEISAITFAKSVVALQDSS